MPLKTKPDTGIAMERPVAVVINASAIPPARGAGLSIPWMDIALNVLIIPETVPRSPRRGVRFATVESIPTFFSRIIASLPPRSSMASFTSHIPFCVFFKPARKILAMDEGSFLHKENASKRFWFLSSCSILLINPSGII